MNYHNITKNDMKNGDGLRVVLWVSGCNHHCKGCHNPITWDPKGGLPFTIVEEDELFNSLNNPEISGVTISGGDPLDFCNRTDVANLICRIRRKLPDKTIWVYTGFKWEDLLYQCTVAANYAPIQRIISSIDVLVDGKFDESLADVNYPWAGSTNQRVIDVKATLNNRNGEVILHESK